MLSNFKKILSNSKIVLALSGGIDSTFLFYQLLQLQKNSSINFKFRAIHVNHQLSPNSLKWSNYCKNICQKYGVKLTIKTIKIKKSNNGIEASARIQRYNTIYKSLKKEEIIVTGHNLNDQCETLLLALKRASGITGLSSMSNKGCSLNNIKIIRPLLKLTRLEIHQWMVKNKRNWIEDESNYKISNDRNFLRHKIIPLLNKRWPFFEKNCSKSAQILNDEKNILNTIISKKIKSYLILPSILNMSTFNSIIPSMRNIILRYWIKLNQGSMPSYNIINHVYKNIILSKQDSNPKIIIKNYEIRKYKNYLYWIKHITETDNVYKNLSIKWEQLYKELKLPYDLGYIIQNNSGIQIPLPKHNEITNIKFHTSEKILTPYSTKRKSLKQIYTYYNIPPWYRTKIPMLFYNNVLICIFSLFVSPHYNNNKENIYLSWVTL